MSALSAARPSLSSALRTPGSSGNAFHPEQDIRCTSRLTRHSNSVRVPLFNSDRTDNSTKPTRKDATATQASQKHKRIDKLLTRVRCGIQTVAVIQAAARLKHSGFECAGSSTASEPKQQKTRRRVASPRKHDSDTINGIPMYDYDTRKGVPTTGRPPMAIDLYCLRPLLNMTQPQAARKLGVSLTSLKMACQRLGVKWTNEWSLQQSEMPATPSSGTQSMPRQSRRASSDPTQLRSERGPSPWDPSYSRSLEMARRGSKAVLHFQNEQKWRRESTSRRPDTPTRTFSDRTTLSIARKDSNQSTKNNTRVKRRSIPLPISQAARHAESSYPAQARVGVAQSSSIFNFLLGLLSIMQTCMRLVMAPVIFVFDTCVSSNSPWTLSPAEPSGRAQEPIYKDFTRQRPNREVTWGRTPSTQDTWAFEALAFDFDYSI